MRGKANAGPASTPAGQRPCGTGSIGYRHALRKVAETVAQLAHKGRLMSHMRE
jgi:hypothetical protein